MNVFEFLLALYSIVAGLGMSLLVRSIGQIIEARSRVRLYWVHSCLIAVAFIAQVVSWFSLWQFADHSPWTVADTLLLLSIPLLLYLGYFELTPPRMLRIGFGLALLPGIVTTHPVVHSVQAAALVVLMAIGVSFVSLTIV